MAIARALARLLLGILFLCGTAPANTAPVPDEPTPLRRVLLISCDTLSARHLGSYGYDRGTATVVDSLAAAGVVFRHCLVPQVWTLSSHMSMLTGLAPGVHRVGAKTALPPAAPLLAEKLHDAGFATGAFISTNHWLNPAFGFDRGFDHYAIYLRSESMIDPVGTWLAKGPGSAAAGSPAAPYLALVHYMDVHTQEINNSYPYAPFRRDCWRNPPWEAGVQQRHLRPLAVADPFPGQPLTQWDLARYDVDFLHDAYDDCITCWDARRLGPLLAELRERGWLHDTLIVLTADHGEQFREHGGHEHRDPYVEVREVPLVLVWPGRLPAGTVVEHPVSLMDLAPTVLDLAGLPPLPGIQGLSLRSWWEDPGSPPPERDFLVDGDHRGFRQEDTGLVARAEGRWWLLVARCDTTGTRGTFRPATVRSVVGLYDLAADPAEQHDLRADRPDMVAHLRQRLVEKLAAEADLAAGLHETAAAAAVELTDEQKRSLKALGY